MQTSNLAEITQATAAGAAPQAAPGAGRLGKNADFASTVDLEALAEAPLVDLNRVTAKLSAVTVNGWYLRSIARELLWKSGAGFRLRSCGAKITRNERGVTVWRRPDRAYGRIGGVCVCGQSVVCPVCAPRIAAFRAAEIEDAYTRSRNGGYEARLETFTMPHRAGSALGVEIDTFAKAWRGLQSGRSSQLVRSGYLGNHTAREITYSAKNGFHYHHHQLRYVRPGTHEEAQMRASWFAQLQAVGRYSDACIEHAYDSELVADERGARYTAKLASCVDAQALAIGKELSLSALKGRNIVQLLGDFSRGDEEAGKVWLHAVAAVCTRKVSSVRWSPGLRDKLGIAAPEKSDADVAAEKAERTDELLGELTALQWRRVLAYRGEFPLVAAAQHGVDAVNTLLSGIDGGELHTDGLPEFQRNSKGLRINQTSADLRESTE